MHIRGRFLLVLLLAWQLPITSLQASLPTSREADGVIRTVDPRTTMMTVEIPKPSRLMAFEWNRDTEIFQHGQFTVPEALKEGVCVRIRYHVPFFGKPFVCKVTLLKCTHQRS